MKTMADDTRSQGNQISFPARLNTGEEVVLEGVLFVALNKREPLLGEIITVTDSSGRWFRGRIVELKEDQARILLFEEMRGPAEPVFDLFLFQALPAKERMELIIQKATELGAKAIIPFKSQHSISLRERELRQPKAHRWQHIALKAAKQCRRGLVPAVGPYCSYEQALEQARSLELKIVLWERGEERLASVLRGMSPSRSVALMVGPEGGWSEAEIRQARESGFMPVNLGGRILRTETAAIAACAILLYEWDAL
jgi:16S rRNA (uracil1498-N3)-methyltransferase